jgi:hypothetical protein
MKPDWTKLRNDVRGKIFTVVFKRRTKGKNGEKPGDLRIMTCRTEVKKHLAGGELKYSPKEKNLLPVWEVNGDGGADAYRAIPLESIVSLTVDGVTYDFRD